MINNLRNIVLLFFIWLLSAFLWAYFLSDPFQGHSAVVNTFISASCALLIILPLLISYLESEDNNKKNKINYKFLAFYVGISIIILLLPISLLLKPFFIIFIGTILKDRINIDILSRGLSLYLRLLAGIIISYLAIDLLKDNSTLFSPFFAKQIYFLLKTIGYNAVSENGFVILPGKKVAIDLVKIGFYFSLTQFIIISTLFCSSKNKLISKIKAIGIAFIIFYSFTIMYGASLSLRILAENYAGTDLFKMVYFDGIIYRALLIIPFLLFALNKYLTFNEEYTVDKRIIVSFSKQNFYLVFTSLAIISLSFLHFFTGFTTEKRINIIFDDVHGKWESTLIKFDDKISGMFAENSYYGFIRYLSNFYNVTIVTDDQRVSDVPNVKTVKSDKITNKILHSTSGETVLILKCSTVKYSDVEIKEIVQFVKDGGKLFIIGDHTNVYFMNDYINEISRNFGIRYDEDSIYMVDGGWLISKAREFKRNIITKYLFTFLWATNCHLNISKPAFSVIKSPISSFSEGADYHKQNFFGNGMIDSSEIFGSYTVLAASKFGKGRVVAFTDSTCFNNYLMFTPGRREFLGGVFGWLFCEELSRFYYMIPLLLFIISIVLFKKNRPPKFQLANNLFIIIPPSIILGFLFSLFMQNTFSHEQQMEDPEKVVLFDSTRKVLHSIVYGSSEEFMLDDSYDDLFFDLPRFGYYPKSLVGKSITRKRLKEGKRLIIVSPIEGYSYFEKMAIKDFVNDGGGLILIEGANNNQAINQIAKIFSLYLVTNANMGFIYDNNSSMRNPCEIKGGIPLFKVADLPVISYQNFGKGRVVAICDDRIFTSVNKEYSVQHIENMVNDIVTSLLDSNDNKLNKIDFSKYLSSTQDISGDVFLPLEREKQNLPFFRH